MDRETLKQDAQEGTDIEQIKKLLNYVSKYYRCGTAADPWGAAQGALLFRVCFHLFTEYVHSSNWNQPSGDISFVVGDAVCSRT